MDDVSGAIRLPALCESRAEAVETQPAEGRPATPPLGSLGSIVQNQKLASPMELECCPKNLNAALLPRTDWRGDPARSASPYDSPTTQTSSAQQPGDANGYGLLLTRTRVATPRARVAAPRGMRYPYGVRAARPFVTFGDFRPHGA